MSEVPKIRKLDPIVINRIAAGEVVQAPANALKELLENSLDAGTSTIQVILKAGGMKYLQVQDDGVGIRKEDLAIVCERFTTSKLEKFEDLQTMRTYGFRGEALASISHVAHLTIVTKTDGSPCAYRCEYVDGQLKPPAEGIPNPKPCAGNEGTSVIVEDLFYNMDVRRRALKNHSEEHNKVLDVVNKYAIHNAYVGFSLKKQGENLAELRTPPKSTTIDNIKLIYGSDVARELVEISCNEDKCQMEMKGYASNVNYSVKKAVFLIFINNRLVDCAGIRKSIDAAYSNYLPKGTHPFVYLDIKINPRNVDVNVHPTKHEVHFLHEDLIIAAIVSSIEAILLGSNESRTFFVQSLLPGVDPSGEETLDSCKKLKLGSSQQHQNSSNPFGTWKNKKSYKAADVLPKYTVRTDPHDQKLEKFFSSTPNPDLSTLKSFDASTSKISFVEPPLTSLASVTSSRNKSPVPGPSRDFFSQKAPESSSAGIKRRVVRLRSVKLMMQKIEEDTDPELLGVIKNHVFVGTVDRTSSLFQCDTNLYICNMLRLSSELFYQILVTDFGNFDPIVIDDPMRIKRLAEIGLDFEAQDTDDPEIKDPQKREILAEKIELFFISKSKMLNDYFRLDIDAEGNLKNIPLLLENYYPSLEGIPSYVVNLYYKVNWNEEQKCFEGFCFQTSLFYAIQPGDDKINEALSPNGHSWKWTAEHIVFPAMRKILRPPKRFADESAIQVLTSLPKLYKVFERC